MSVQREPHQIGICTEARWSGYIQPEAAQKRWMQTTQHGSSTLQSFSRPHGNLHGGCWIVKRPQGLQPFGPPVLKRGLQAQLGARFHRKQLFVAPLLLPELPALPTFQDLSVDAVPQVSPTIAHRSLAGRC